MLLSRLHRRLYLFPTLLLPLEWACTLLVALTYSPDVEGIRQVLLLGGTGSALFPLLTGIGAWFGLPRGGTARGFAALHGFLQFLVVCLYAVLAWPVWNGTLPPVAPWPQVGIKAVLLLLLFTANRIARRYIRRGMNSAAAPSQKTDGTPI
ncbi:hypothetical protein [Flaviaesturariibacter amylovorans]|uniref:DUF2231 domain-containing protein n=1 Tax=Flaviaesturariibacter amylovorans TaxID=1084520 RepID=A0ABP8H1Y3_9BACT